MKKLFLFLALFGVLAVGCEELLPNEQTPADIPTEQPSETPEEKPTFNTDAAGNYVVDANGGEIVVTITTNLEYNIVIPDAAQSWLSVADTRVEVREEILTFIVAANESFEERSATVELTKADGEVLQAISFVQDAAIETEIWYTNGSTTEATTPNITNAFGANIVSNTYDAEKECWVIKFDGRVTTIGDSAFTWCDSLTSVTIGNGVTTIEDFAFAWCESLTSVTIPDSVTTIREGAFVGCSSLQEFNGKFASEDDRCWIIDGTLNAFAPAGLTEYTIPNSVTTIGLYAFNDCYSLTSVTIPDSVTTIGENAFWNCSSLTSVTIGDSVTTIEDFAFLGCSSLTSVTIPDSVTEIGYQAFYNCSSLKKVYCNATIPPSLGDFAFGNNAYGRRIYVYEECVELYKSAWGSDGIYTNGQNCPDTTTIEYTTTDGNTITSSNLPIISNSYDNGVGTMVISGIITVIPDDAFRNCSNLTSVTIPDSVTTIRGYAFYECSSLTSVTIPDSVTEIGAHAFEGCSSLTSVTIPDSVTEIGYGAFSGCSSLTSVYCKPTTPPVGDTDMFYKNASGRKIYVPMESVNKYKSAIFGWSWYQSDIVGYEF